MKKCEIIAFRKNKNCVGLVKASKKIDNFQKDNKNENLVFRSDFLGLCPAWLVKIKKWEKIV